MLTTAAGLVMSVAVLAPQPATAAADDTTCCFTNPRYTGTCEETPGPDETCADILAYLNNPNAVGKAYCGKTDIRGGWSEVSCDAEEQSTACGHRG